MLLHSKAYEYAKIMADSGEDVVDLSFVGGLAREDQIFKALALGSPFTKLICMGRALMVPAFVGTNIEGVLHPTKKQGPGSNWTKLPPTVEAFGDTESEIFACYYDVQNKVGKDEMKKIPFGAIATWTLADKLSAGLQQLMAGARKFSVSEITRNEIWSANRETERETGITFITEESDDIAKAILRA